MNQDAQIEEQRIGPHWSSITALHPLQLMMATLLLLFPFYEPHIAAMKFTLTLLSSAEHLLVDILKIGPCLGVSISRIGLAWLAVVIVWSLIVYKSRSYILTRGAIIMNSGIFTQTSNTIRYDMVYECDIRRALGDRSIGIGTMIIRPIAKVGMREDYKIELPYVYHPDEARAIILSGSSRGTMGGLL